MRGVTVYVRLMLNGRGASCCIMHVATYSSPIGGACAASGLGGPPPAPASALKSATRSARFCFGNGVVEYPYPTFTAFGSIALEKCVIPINAVEVLLNRIGLPLESVLTSFGSPL